MGNLKMRLGRGINRIGNVLMQDLTPRCDPAGMTPRSAATEVT